MLWQQSVILLLLLSQAFCIKVGVIGGGAAGYFAAIRCAEVLALRANEKHEVVIFEMTRDPLAKVLISGGGRCNVQHDPSKPIAVIAKGYPRGERELLSPMTAQFGPEETNKWFVTRGVELKTESDGRVFPVTDRSMTIKNALTEAAAKTGFITVLCQQRVQQISRDQDKNIFKIITNVDGATLTASTSYECDSIIFATGSSKLGHEIMKGLGHHIVPAVPSLFSFKISDQNLTNLSGLSTELSEIKLVLTKEMLKEHKQVLRQNMLPTLKQQGALLVTHQGISGPGVLRLSAFGAKIMAAVNYKFEVEIKWIPGVTEDEIIKRLSEEKVNNPSRTVGKCFPGFDEASTVLSRRLWQYIVHRAQIDPETTWQRLSKADMQRLVSQVVEGRYQVDGRGVYRDEFVTAGGVDLREVNFETMESKIVPGLFLAGEVLDIDGVTGGYNFQSAWTAGWVAGNSCARTGQTVALSER